MPQHRTQKAQQPPRENPSHVGLLLAIGVGSLGALGLLAWAMRRGNTTMDNKNNGNVTGTAPPTMTAGVSPRAPGRVYVAGGVLHGPVGNPTTLTDEDMLWLGRAIVGETGGRNAEWAAAVAWALAQNMKLVRRTSPFTTFTGIVRAYCQPVNPIWASASAAGCQRSPQACTEAHLLRRQQISSMTWGALPEATRNAVTAFRAGTLANPVPGAVDWHANHFQGATTEIGGNWFGVGASRRLV